MAGKPCVVITRLPAQGEGWAQQLHHLGFGCRLLPLLQLQAPQDETRLRAIKNKILDFDLYQKAIFVSQNAVDYGMAWLEDYWPQLPIGIDYFAVGATTARRLADYGIAVTDLAQSETGGMTSEDLLQAPALQQVEGEKILIFRGLGGRGQLAESLRARGAWVDYCELYERIIPTQAQSQLEQLMVDAKHSSSAFILALHSGESLQNLLQLAAQLAPPVLLQLQEWPLLVPSERVAQLAREAGFTRVIAAQNATDTAMTQALLDYTQASSAPV